MLAETAYLFRHALLRDAAYQLQLPGDRARLHGLALEAIEGLCGSPPEFEGPLTGGRKALRPHPSDPFAAEIAVHAQEAGAIPDAVQARDFRRVHRLYLRRAAALADASFQREVAERLWLEFSGVVDGPERGEALRLSGVDAHQKGRSTEGVPRIEAAIGIFRDCGDLRGEAIAIGTLASCSKDLGLPDVAESRYARSIEILRGLNCRPDLAVALSNLGGLLHQIGREAEAEAADLEALTIHKESGNRRGVAQVLTNLALLHRNSAKTRSLTLEALEISREIGNRRSEAIAMGNLACDLRVAGELDRAAELSAQALALHREVGNRQGEGIVLREQALLHLDLGNQTLAEEELQRAIAIHRELNDLHNEGVTLGNLAILMMYTGRLEAAESHFLSALALHRKVRNRYFEGKHLCAYAHLLVIDRRYPQAREEWKAGSALLRELGDPDFGRDARAVNEACAALGFPALEASPP